MGQSVLLKPSLLLLGFSPSLNIFISFASSLLKIGSSAAKYANIGVFYLFVCFSHFVVTLNLLQTVVRSLNARETP